jgi:hypothetical protein
MRSLKYLKKSEKSSGLHNVPGQKAETKLAWLCPSGLILNISGTNDMISDQSSPIAKFVALNKVLRNPTKGLI